MREVLERPGRFMSLFLLAGALVALLTASQPAYSGGEDDDGGLSGIIGPKQAVKLTGKTYGEWGERWWNWVLQFPFATNPLFDETGASCGLRQRGRIWFLAGNFGGTSARECTVPSGKILFIPILNTVWWTPEDGSDVETIRAIANSFVDPATVLELDIDGEPVGDLFAYRGESPPGGFVLSLPPGGLGEDFGFPPGDRDPAVTDGYWMMLAPLDEGQHVIHFHAVAPEGPLGYFELDVTYHLTVGDDDDDDDDR